MWGGNDAMRLSSQAAATDGENRASLPADPRRSCALTGGIMLAWKSYAEITAGGGGGLTLPSYFGSVSDGPRRRLRDDEQSRRGSEMTPDMEDPFAAFSPAIADAW